MKPILDVVSIVLTLAGLAAGLVLIITWRRLFERVRKDRSLDTEDRKRVARKTWALSLAMGSSMALVGLLSIGDSQSIPARVALPVLLVCGGGFGVAGVMLFSSACKIVEILLVKKGKEEA